VLHVTQVRLFVLKRIFQVALNTKLNMEHWWNDYDKRKPSVKSDLHPNCTYCNTSVLPSQWTQSLSTMKISRLMLYRENISIYCENHTERTNREGKIQTFLMFSQLVLCSVCQNTILQLDGQCQASLGTFRTNSKTDVHYVFTLYEVQRQFLSCGVHKVTSRQGSWELGVTASPTMS